MKGPRHNQTHLDHCSEQITGTEELRIPTKACVEMIKTLFVVTEDVESPDTVAIVSSLNQEVAKHGYDLAKWGEGPLFKLATGISLVASNMEIMRRIVREVALSGIKDKSEEKTKSMINGLVNPS